MKYVSRVLILSGIILLSIPVGARLFFNFYMDPIVPEEYIIAVQKTPEEPAPLTSAPVETASAEQAAAGQMVIGTPPPAASVAPTVPSSVSSAPNNTAPTATPKPVQTVLGLILIEKIKVNLTIVEGVEPSNLAVGAGHVPGTAMPGMDGNCVIAAHRNSMYNNFFKYLDKLESGDTVTLRDGNKEYTYVVSGSTVVTPSEVSVLKSTAGRSELTLITCTPIYIATHRLVVTAYLLPEQI